MKKSIILMSLMLMSLSVWANGDGEGGSSLRLSMGGSTTVEPIMTSAMEVYLEEVDPSASLSYDAPGSTAGIRGVMNGVYDMGASSRELLRRLSLWEK